MSKEIIMAEITVAEDAIDTVKGAEKFLPEARNRGPNDGDDHLPPGAIRPDATPPDRHDAGGAAAGGVGGRERGGGEGPPQPPEGFRRFDWEQHQEVLWSKEFRAELWHTAAELGKLEGKPDEERYDGGANEKSLYDYYRYWKYLEYLDNKRSYLSKPFDPADFEPIQITSEESSQAEEDHLTDLHRFEIVFAYYNRLRGDRNSAPEQLARAENEVTRYFNELKRMGLLRGIDDSLKSIYAQIMQGMEIVVDEDGRGRRRMDKDQIMDRVEKARAAMSISARRALETLKRSDRAKVDLEKIDKLEGSLEKYVELAVGRFDLLLNGEGLTQPPSIKGEFTFDIEDVGSEATLAFRKLAAEGEIFWRPTWANYFEVTARTEQQFDRAVETFIRWMRTGLGKDPQELFQKVNGFKEAITSAGQRANLQEHTVGLRLLLEALMGVIGADFSNEQYKDANFKAFWEFAAKNEGPARMLELVKTSRGILAALLHKFDKDPKLELLFSPHGSRGQLMGRGRNAIEMGDLQKQLLAVLTAEVMGIAMKGYHPDDSERILDSGMYKRNLGEIIKFKSDEYFENLYEGFDLVKQEALLEELEANPVIQKIKFAKSVDERTFIGPRTPEQEEFYQDWKSGEFIKRIREQERNIKFARWIDAQIKKGQRPVLTGKRLEIYKAWDAGTLPRPEIALSQLQVWERLDRASRIQKYLEAGNDPDELTGEDRIMYQEARNAVTLAYELYGAMGEKAKRGGGVFLAERRDDNGHKFFDYIPHFWAERGGHFVENWTKAEYSHILADDLKYKVDQARRIYIWALKVYGASAKFWDFTLLQNGRPVDPNTLGYTQYGINRNATNRIDKFRYAVPENPRILGFNSRGEEVILVFDDNGKPVLDGTNELKTGLLFEHGKAAIYRKFFSRIDRVGPVDKEGNPVQPTQDDRIVFDNLDDKAKAWPMELKIPRGNIDPKTDQMIVEGEPERVHVDFDKIIHRFRSHPYARWTGHPYWGYQEEDTGLVLSAEAFDAARKIKAGQLRPEDAPPHAVQLLIVDPTLERVGHFDLESLETLVALAAVEESYQAHWRIGDELYLNFFPADASRLKNRTEYVLQDHGGSTKEWFHARAEAALWPDVKVRRLRTFIPYIPIHFASMSEMWGAPRGALDVFRMMGYDKYQMVGQFAMDKWVNQTGGAQKVYEAIADWFDEQAWKLREGLGRKFNNEADRLRKFHKQHASGKLGDIPTITTDEEDTDEEFLQMFRETLNRPEVLVNRVTVLESVFRGERAPLYLEGREIYQRRLDGGYILDESNHRMLNPAIDWERDSGSSRHSNRLLVYRYARLVRSDQPREGQDLYRAEARYYELGDYYTLASLRLAKEAKDAGDPNWQRFLETRWEWYDAKVNN